MRKLIRLAVLILSVCFAQQQSWAGEMDSSMKGAVEKDQPKFSENAVFINNKICPVSDEEIKADEVVQVEYEGKVYNFCCSMCLKDFNKDPQKFIQKLQDKGEMKSQSNVNEIKELEDSGDGMDADDMAGDDDSHMDENGSGAGEEHNHAEQHHE